MGVGIRLWNGKHNKVGETESVMCLMLYLSGGMMYAAGFLVRGGLTQNAKGPNRCLCQILAMTSVR